MYYCIYFFFFFFFFSSRRRHTRWTGDWSSDVCSSDLYFVIREEHTKEFAISAGAIGGTDKILSVNEALFIRCVAGGRSRSEERRVGKECRSRWWPYH